MSVFLLLLIEIIAHLMLFCAKSVVVLKKNIEICTQLK